MKPPVDTIIAPAFPPHLPWINAEEPLRMDRLVQEGPVLIEFWDFCRPNSIRTMPYVRAWHERYAEAGLRVIGVHSPGFEPSKGRRAVIDAVARLDISYPVMIDSELEFWRDYENLGWPVRYLFDQRGRLFEYHYGEGDYETTERAVQDLLGVSRDPIAPLRPEDVPGMVLAAQTEDQVGAYSGPYEAGGVWAVLEGTGTVTVAVGELAWGDSDGIATLGERLGGEDGGPGTIERELTVTHPGAYPLIEHDRHTVGVLDLGLSPGVVCHATCFTPGVA